MKRAFQLGSLFCIAIGALAVLIGVLNLGNAWTVAALVLAYFGGIPTVFLFILDDETSEKIANDDIIFQHGARYWFLMAGTVIASAVIGYAYIGYWEAPIFSGIHIALGIVSMFTAVIKPKIIENVNEMHDVFG